MERRENRIEWIDMAKGYGMLLCIMGHVGIGSLHDWIYSFHMPLFFFLSGCVFSMRFNFGTFVKRKVRSMIVPYVCLGIPMVLFEPIGQFLRGGEETAKTYVELFFDFVLQRRMFTLWFVTCLFLLNIIFWITLEYFKSHAVLTGFAVTSCFVGWWYYSHGGVPLVWNLDVCFMAYPFFYVGFLFKKKSQFFYDKIHANWKLVFLLCVVFSGINIGGLYGSIFLSGSSLEMYLSQYGCLPLTYLSAFAGIAMVVVVSMWNTAQPVKYIGENSLLYLAWHNTIMIPMAIYMLSRFQITQDSMCQAAEKLLYKGLIFIIVIVGCTLVNVILSKTKMKFMLGK